MIRINLLPFRSVRKKENIKQQVIVYGVSILVVIAPLIWYHLNLKEQIADLNSKISQTERALQEQERKAKQVDEYTAKLEELKKKIAAVANLEKGRRDTFERLLDLTDMLIVNRMWFTSLDISEKETREGTKVLSTTHVRIDGVAYDDQTVANFMKNLQSLDRFASVSLVVTETTKVTSTMELKKFTLQCLEKPIVTGEVAAPPPRRRR